MTTKLVRTTITLIISLVLVACGANKESATSDQPVTDITRPPQTVKEGADKPQQETNPDETISYDEWRRRREAEIKGETP